MKTIGKSHDGQGPRSQSEEKKRLQGAAARMAEAAGFVISGLSAEDFAKSHLGDRHSLKPSPKQLRIWGYVFSKSPSAEAFLIDGLREEEGLLRKDAIGAITEGENGYIPGLSPDERSEQLKKMGHPIQASGKQLSALRLAYIRGGRTVQALLDGQRGGKGAFRGWLADPTHQQLVRDDERQLIITSHEPYPGATLLRVKLCRRVGSKLRDQVPSAKTLDRFRRNDPQGISPGERTALARGDRAYDVAFSPKMPTKFGERDGEIITYDHTPADVFVRWGDRVLRPDDTTCINPGSGVCRQIIVSPYAAGSAEVALVIRGAIREKPKSEDPHQVLCGLPVAVYAERGKDMLSSHIRAALHELGIKDTHGRGYAPFSRGSIEGNLHKCIHTMFEPELPGYVGNDPKKRPPDVNAVLSFEEYASALRLWVFTVFNNMKYSKRRLDGQRASRLEFALDNHAPIVMPSKDVMMFALLKRKPVTVADTGVHFGGLFTYWPHEQQQMEAFLRLIQERALCELRFDPSDMSVTYLFRDGQLLMELYDARAAKAQATERDLKWFEALRARGRKEMRERTRPEREAAQSPEAFLEHMEELRAEAEEMPAAAVAGGGRVIRKILPLDHALRSPAALRTATAAPKPRRSSDDPWNPWGKR